MVMRDEMDIKLTKAKFEDLDTILQMQKEAFAELYGKYQDAKTSPATEKYENILFRFNQPETTYYFITADNVKVGVIRIVDCKDSVTRKRISPIFIMPEYRNQGYAQQAIKEAERTHGNQNWKLDTILQEEGNCYLYEKLGYHQTGKTEQINERMTIVFYEKD
jgi:RimJ/RimL family protein N-acetyltransferase